MKSCVGTGIVIIVLIAGIGGGFALIHSGMNSGSTPSMIWGTIITIVCFYLILGQLLISDRINISNKAYMWILFAAPLAIVALAFGISWWMIQNSRPPAKVLSALSEVCDHKGVAAAGIYSPDENSHPRIVLMSADGSTHPWTSEVNPEWRPASIEQVELVICLGEIKRRVIDTCTSQSGTISLEVEEVDVEIVTPKSGEVLASRTITASPSPKCPINAAGFYKPSEWRDQLTFVHFQDVEFFITSFLSGITSDNVSTSTAEVQNEQPRSSIVDQTPAGIKEVQQSIFGIVTVSSARVRSGPGTQFGVVAGLRNGEQVTILGRNLENTWYKIELADGESGWASVELIKLMDEEQEIPLVTE